MTRNGSVDLWTLFVSDSFDQSVTADTDILESDITLTSPKKFQTLASFTFEVTFEDAGNFYFVVKDGTTEKIIKTLNGSNQGANCGGTYNILLTDGYSLNIRYSTTTTLNYLTITGHGGRI